MAKVLMALSSFCKGGQEPRDLLESSGHEIVYNPHGRRVTREEIIEFGSDCEGVLAGVEPYDEWVLGHMSDLRCISRAGVGTDAIDHKVCADRGIVIRNTPDVVVAPVAEHALAMAFALSKRLPLQTERLKAKDWHKAPGRMIAGSTVAVIGLGRIGRRVAEAFTSVGADVLGVDPYPDPAWAETASVNVVTLAEALATADLVSLHLTAEDFLLGEAELGSMKPGAILLNLARGKYVDEDALYDAVSSGHLGGVGLDVFPAEPYAGKLCELENVVLTPHVATFTRESRLQMEIECVANLLEELSG